MKKKVLGLVHYGETEVTISFLGKRQSNRLCKFLGCRNVFDERPSLDVCIKILKLFNIPYKHTPEHKQYDVIAKMYYTRYDLLTIPKGYINKEFINKYF